MAEKENKEIKKANETLNRISLDPKEREIYESIVQAEFNQRISNQKFLEEGIAKGKAEGKAEGIKEGEAKGKAEGIKEGEVKGKAEGEKQKGIEVAKKLLEKNIDIQTIIEVTGISKEEIQKLKEKSKM